jgi:AcrR family transcriptional regulator
MSLIEAAARLLADEGRPAVTARRLATEAGTSTMAVYTHFGGMDELLVQMCQEGFARFGASLASPGLTDDPVADWVTQGWAYRHFALDNPHLYRVMFNDGLDALRSDDPASMETFLSLLRRIQRCVDAGRLVVPDVHLAGEVVWASVHGHMMIELTGCFESMGRDAPLAFAEGMRRLALGYGDQPDALEVSMRAAWRRSRRLRAA